MDRLQEARDMNDMNLTEKQVAIHEWLIGEVEDCRDEIKELTNELEQLEDRQ